MIVSGRGYRAIFLEDGVDVSLPVVVWQETGSTVQGLVLDDTVLVPASEFITFVGYQEDLEHINHIVPAGPGWWCVSQDPNNPAIAYWVRLIAWRVALDGFTDGITQPECDPACLVVFNPHTQAVYDPNREREGFDSWPAIPGEEAAALFEKGSRDA